MHKTHSTRRYLKNMLKRAFGSQKRVGGNSHAEPCDSCNTTPPPRISSLPFLLPSDAQKQPSREVNRKPVPAKRSSPSSSSSSSGNSPYQSLRRSTILLEQQPRFHDLLDSSTWPSLPLPTNLWHTPEQLNLMIRRWLDSPDSALPPPAFQHACPIAYHHIRGIMTGDGINDWVY